ncbi:MAG: class I mannose-6-phosphate isomerase [Acidobacteriales bacterium]|nr:class I mannose-6-phosphate isomerase [Terriglobales bacterium]
MVELYPLLMSPVFDPRPWGTENLAPIYPNHTFAEKIGETWLTGSDNKVADGPLAGKSLGELTAEYGRKLVGRSAPDAAVFPLLLKFLFPEDKLSVQVHPGDEQAREDGLPCGKTECWYVAHARPGAQVAIGLKPGITRNDLREAILQNHAEEILNWVNVYPGEMIYVPGGTVHTMAAGSVLVETQQQSDTTYRLYDYGRERELHLDKGLAAVREEAAAGKVIRPAPTALNGNGSTRSPLVRSRCFTVEMLHLKGEYLVEQEDTASSSVQILVAVDGFGAVDVEGMPPQTFAKGQAVVIPASIPAFRIRPQWSVEVLRAFVSNGVTAEPAVRR